MWRLTNITVLLCAGAAVAGAQSSSAPGTPSGPGAATATSAATRSLTGCLRAGEQQNTFVLTVSGDSAGISGSASDRTTDRNPVATGTAGTTPIKTTTYELTAAGAGLDLRRYVGQRVSVSGMLDPASKKTVASADTATEAQPDATPRDGATPVVSTTEATRVQAQRMQVASVQPVGGSCQ